MTVTNCSDCETPIAGSAALRGDALLCSHCAECPDGADCAEDPCPNVTDPTPADPSTPEAPR